MKDTNLNDLFKTVADEKVSPPASLWSRIDATLDKKASRWSWLAPMQLRMAVTVVAVFAVVSVSGTFMMLEQQMYNDLDLYLNDMLLYEEMLPNGNGDSMTELGTFL